MKYQLIMGLNLKRSVSHQFVNDGRGCVPGKGSNARVPPRVCTNRVVKFPGATQKDKIEEHTSELQSQFHLVCRLLLEKKKQHLPGESASRCFPISRQRAAAAG